MACSLVTKRSAGIPVSLTDFLLAGYIQIACWGSQRSSSTSFFTVRVGLRLAEPLALAPSPTGVPAEGVAGAVVDPDLVVSGLSSESVLVSGRGRGISGAGSMKSHGSSSSPRWLAPK